MREAERPADPWWSENASEERMLAEICTERSNWPGKGLREETLPPSQGSSVHWADGETWESQRILGSDTKANILEELLTDRFGETLKLYMLQSSYP